MVSTDIGIWLSVVWIVIVYSFTIRDSPLFKFAEATAIGATAGVFTVVAVDNIKKLAILPLINKNAYINIIPLLIGLLMFTQISRRHIYLSKIPISLMIGCGVGSALATYVTSNIIIQLGAVMKPLSITPLGIINTIILIISLVGTLLVFTYTRQRKGLFGRVTKYGEYLMMMAMGASFGNLVTMRATYVISRLQIIVYDLLAL